MKTRISLSVLMVVSLVACTKTDLRTDGPKPTSTNETRAFKDIAGVVLSTIKSNDIFRTVAYAECNKQKYGDYYVKLDELISLNETYHYWNAATVAKLSSLEKEITAAKRNDVIIFIPSMEVHPEKVNMSKNHSMADLYQEPIAVIADEYQSPTQTCPGYIVNINGALTFYKSINESFAWENDVWVIGEEENCSPENMVAAPGDTATLTYARVNGGAEYGGIVKVTDWSVVEPWVAGKVEFRMVVYKGAGEATKIYDERFGKWRRVNFNNKFKDFDRFLYNWNQSNIGEYVSEKWIEEDGGPSFTLTFGVKVKIFGVETNFGVALPIQNKDDDLGLSLIQFTDPVSTEYSQSGIKIKRKN